MEHKPCNGESPFRAWPSSECRSSLWILRAGATMGPPPHPYWSRRGASALSRRDHARCQTEVTDSRSTLTVERGQMVPEASSEGPPRLSDCSTLHLIVLLRETFTGNMAA